MPTQATQATQATLEGITGYWLPEQSGHACSVCGGKGFRVLHLGFGEQRIFTCGPCGVTLRELLIDALAEEADGGNED